MFRIHLIWRIESYPLTLLLPWPQTPLPLNFLSLCSLGLYQTKEIQHSNSFSQKSITWIRLNIKYYPSKLLIVFKEEVLLDEDFVELFVEHLPAVVWEKVCCCCLDHLSRNRTQFGQQLAPRDVGNSGHGSICF